MFLMDLFMIIGIILYKGKRTVTTKTIEKHI